MDADILIMLGVILFMLYTSIFYLLVFFSNRKEIKNDPQPTKKPLISIVIPVFKGDKEQTVRNSVVSALAVEYPKKEIILAWNGPKTNAFDVCREFEKKGLAKVLYTSSIGKAAGLNLALQHLKGEYFCCLDADSFLERNALNKMVGYLDNPKVAAVTTAMKVHNPKNMLQKMQWIEYIFAIYLRKMMSLIDCLYVVPGPGGLYRTETVKKVGCFDENVLTEDMEIAFRLQKKGYRIENSVNAFVDTIAPAKFSELVRQRVRWYTGFCDTVRMYKSFVLNPKHGSLGMYVLPASFLWVLVLFYTITKLGINIVTSLETPVKTILLTGFNPSLLFKRFVESLYFQPGFMTWFVVVFTIIGIGGLWLSIKIADEAPDVKRKHLSYVTYIFLYAIMLTVFWIASLAHMVTRGFTKTKMRW